MKSLKIASVLAITFLSIAAPHVRAQNQVSDQKPAAVKPRIILNNSDCNRIDDGKKVITSCKGLNGGPVEFRIEDLNSPTNVTVIKAQTIQLDSSTAEIKAEGNVTVTLEILKPK
jgi:lipopolysaccharide assembly outer membrane protein LptD (OstA)